MCGMKNNFIARRSFNCEHCTRKIEKGSKYWVVKYLDTKGNIRLKTCLYCYASASGHDVSGVTLTEITRR
jgi:hypothetical protein